MLVLPVTLPGFLEVSQGNYATAETVLAEEMARLDAARDGTEV